MRYVPRTKKERLELVEAQIKNRTDKGYSLEIYKGLKILTNTEEGKSGTIYMLIIYRDAAAHPVANFYYRSAEQRTTSIENFKKNYDRRIEYKAEAKKNQTISTAANCAKAVRAELAQAFAGIKFSVTSENFSMGNAVRVGWVDGPTTSQVDDLLNKYEYGRFNGQEDIYEDTNRRDDIPQTKYLTTSRGMSPETRATLEPIAEKLFEGYEDRNSLYRVFSNSFIPSGATVTGIESTEEMCGSIETMYRITYELPAGAQTKSAPEQLEKVEVIPGTVQIIEHPFRKGKILVVGDTKPIKDRLKILGGWWNRFEIGWEFKAADFEKIKYALEQIKKGPQGIADLPEETQKLIEQDFNSVTEILTPKELPPAQTNSLRDEIVKTVEFFAEHDQKTIGAVSESTMEIARVQNVKLPDDVEHYDTLEDIEDAANSGKIISLCNLSELVNKPKTEELNAWGQTSAQARAGAQQRRMDKAMKSHGAARRSGKNTATYY